MITLIDKECDQAHKSQIMNQIHGCLECLGETKPGYIA